MNSDTKVTMTLSEIQSMMYYFMDQITACKACGASALNVYPMEVMEMHKIKAYFRIKQSKLTGEKK